MFRSITLHLKTIIADRRSFNGNINDRWSVVKPKNDQRSFFLLFH